MADVAVRGQEGRPEGLTRLGEAWEPFRHVQDIMRDMLRWDPFREMSPPRLLAQRPFVPDFDIKETKDAFIVTADLPGVKPDEIEVNVQQNLLTVSGSRNEEQVEEGETYHSCQRSYGGFTRSFALPESADPDRVSANLKEGVLKLSIPKRPGTESKRIKVQGS